MAYVLGIMTEKNVCNRMEKPLFSWDVVLQNLKVGRTKETVRWSQLLNYKYSM